MKDEKEIIATPEVSEPSSDVSTELTPDVVAPVAVVAPRGRAGGRAGNQRGGPGGRRPSSRPPRAKSEYDQKMITIRRVARTVAGGRRFSFSVALIIGNKKGKVGVGLGKAGDTTLAIDKAVRNAKKNMITVNLTKDNSIAHRVSAKYTASRVELMPVRGRGLVAARGAHAGARPRPRRRFLCAPRAGACRHYQHRRQNPLGQQKRPQQRPRRYRSS